MKTSKAKVKGGMVHIQPVSELHTARLKGGNVARAKLFGGSRGDKKGDMSKTHKGEKDYTTKKSDKDFHEDGHDIKKSSTPFSHGGKGMTMPSLGGGELTREQTAKMTPRQLKKYLEAKSTEGYLQREAVGSSRDLLLAKILEQLHQSEKAGQTHGRGLGKHTGKGLTTARMSGGSANPHHAIVEKLSGLVKNEKRLTHLKDMGINLNSYSPYLVRAVVDGDYRSYRTTNKGEWDRMVNESALKGVDVNVMGRKTQFGRNLQGFLTNGKYGGEVVNTDDMRNAMTDMDATNGGSEALAVRTREGLEGGSMVNVSRPVPTDFKPDKDSMISRVISLSINSGYNVAIDFLNSIKSLLTEDEYKDLYAYLGQTSLPLR